jgi:hypothetical protein
VQPKGAEREQAPAVVQHAPVMHGFDVQTLV